MRCWNNGVVNASGRGFKSFSAVAAHIYAKHALPASREGGAGSQPLAPPPPWHPGDGGPHALQELDQCGARQANINIQY